MPPRPRPSRRHLARLLGAVVGLRVVATGVAAHEGVADGGQPVGLLPLFLVVAGTGVLAGVLAAYGRAAGRGRLVSNLVTRAVGPLLVAIGVLAVGSALASQPAVGLVGVGFGAVVGLVLVLRGDRETCTGTTVGAIALHRLVEGVTLATAYATGSTVGLLGAVVLAGHTVAECVAVGGSEGFGRRRAVTAVVFVVATFAAGVLLGTVASTGLPAALRLVLLAVVGGLLVALGTDETRATFRPHAPA